MKLYENVVIGNFLYGLGFAVGVKNQSENVPSVVSLLQQTPADKLLGDLLLEFPGVVRLIEFKNRENKSNKEKEKHKRLTEKIKSQVEEYDDYIRISRSIHWFIETHPQKNNFVSRIVPYLDAYPKDNSLLDLGEFIESTAEDILKAQSKCSHQEVCNYIHFVSSLLGTKKIGTGGLLLSANSSGSLGFIELTDMSELNLYRSELINVRQKQEELLIQPIPTVKPKYEKGITRDISLER